MQQKAGINQHIPKFQPGPIKAAYLKVRLSEAEFGLKGIKLSLIFELNKNCPLPLKLYFNIMVKLLECAAKSENPT